MGNVSAIDFNNAIVCTNNTSNHIKAGGFACAIRAEQSHYFSCANLQRYVSDDGPAPIGLGEMVCAEGASHQNHYRGLCWHKKNCIIIRPRGKGQRIIILHAVTKDGPLINDGERVYVDEFDSNEHPTAEMIFTAKKAQGDYHDTMDGDMSSATLNSSRTSLGPSPKYFWMSSDPTTRRNDADVELATALASRVFPVPGSP